jgi:hypothetical protein
VNSIFEEEKGGTGQGSANTEHDKVLVFVFHVQICFSMSLFTLNSPAAILMPKQSSVLTESPPFRTSFSFHH